MNFKERRNFLIVHKAPELIICFYFANGKLIVCLPEDFVLKVFFWDKIIFQTHMAVLRSVFIRIFSKFWWDSEARESSRTQNYKLVVRNEILNLWITGTLSFCRVTLRKIYSELLIVFMIVVRVKKIMVFEVWAVELSPIPFFP